MKKEMLANVATAVLALCALTITGLVVRRELFAPAPAVALQAPEGTAVAGWRAYAGDGNTAGPADAPVSVVVFSDFQCPACRMLVDSLRVLRRKHPRTVRVVYRHFPLDSHPFAVPAARASECAGAQGRFEAYHDVLFARQESIGRVPWADHAAEAGVADLPRFGACMSASAELPALARDLAMARRLEVDRTPTFLVNGTRYEGARPVSMLEGYVERALRAGDR